MRSVRSLLVVIAILAVGLLVYRAWRTPRCHHITTVNGTTTCSHPLGKCPDLMRANR
jgi:hypothetical protein